MKFIDLPSSFWAEKKVIEFRVTQSRIPVSITSRKWGLIKKENKCPTEDGKYNRSVEDHKRICCHSFVWESNLRKRMVLCCSSEPRIMYRASGFDEKPTRPQPIESCNILACCSYVVSLFPPGGRESLALQIYDLPIRSSISLLPLFLSSPPFSFPLLPSPSPSSLLLSSSCPSINMYIHSWIIIHWPLHCFNRSFNWGYE